jgi:type IV secretory pathway ATPase VirB11/archaellum biosynthesis ATPase
MQISNVRRIIVEDYPEDSRETVGKLATVINSFMDEMVSMSRNKVDFDNLNRSLITVDVTVGTDGSPKGVNQINTKLSTYSGNKIINVQSLQGGDNTISAPYLDCTSQGNGLVKINKIHGLPANKKLRISIEFIG